MRLILGMAETGLYTCDELVDKLKALDTLMDEAETRSEIDTGQSEHKFQTSIRTLREQYNKYLAMLKVQCPDKYHAIVGPSVIKFGGSNCR